MIRFSKYPTAKSIDKIDIDIQDYIDMVQKGTYQDLVLKARSLKNDEVKYKECKIKAPCITGSAVMKNGSKTADNIDELNGLIVIDIDDDVDLQLLNKINQDKYTMMSHRSFGGDGLCVFIKINSNKFLESFNELAQYYWDNFNVAIDPSCKNKNRLRFISYDPYLFLNENSKKFIAKQVIKKDKTHNFVFVNDDFQTILSQIQEKQIDLCQDDYDRYVRIGFAIASRFGESGFVYFDAICKYGSKYDANKIEKHYKNFCKNNGQVSISTIYFYAKEAGLKLYSEKTETIINRVSVAKSQGTPTIESVKKSLEKINNITDADEDLIKFLIDSKKDFKQLDENLTDSKKLQNFIFENYNPVKDIITNEVFINGQLLDDVKLNTIYFACKNYLDFIPSKSDVRDMINSEHTTFFNPLTEFFKQKLHENSESVIDDYINCIEPKSDYNIWAFKKWIVGCVHNWVAPLNETKVSPLTLVLCGQKQGTGKTSFFRNLLPPDLQKYLIEHKIDAKDKDSIYNLVKGLLVLDDEFGGLATRDVKDFKKVADTNMVDIRLPYSSFYSKLKRRASLCGTSNEKDVLKDVTGNRRILPINVDKIDYDRLISLNTTNLWLEAYQMYLNGFDWKIFSNEDIYFLEKETIKNIENMPVEDLFFDNFSLVKNDFFDTEVILSQGQILNFLNGIANFVVTKYDVKDIITKNKLENKLYKKYDKVMRGYCLYTQKSE
jgi:hypothetical protein